MAIIAAIATVIALPSIVALARLFRSRLYGVTNFEPLTLSATITLTAARAALAAALRLRARKIRECPNLKCSRLNVWDTITPVNEPRGQ